MITSNLNQIITSKNVILFVIACFEKCVEIPIFIVFFWKQPKNDQKNAPPKNDNFSHFAKHKFIKKNEPLCCNPLFFLNLHFLKKNTGVEQKPNLKSGKKQRSGGFERKKKRGNQQKWERIDEPKLCNWIFWCCSFHETKAKKKPKERKRQKQENKRKQKRKTRRKEERKEKERDRERKSEKGGGHKKAMEKERETMKNKQKSPF